MGKEKKIKKILLTFICFLFVSVCFAYNMKAVYGATTSKTTTLGTPKVTTAVSKRDVTMSWKKISNATGYQILLYDTNSKLYRWYKTIKTSNNVNIKLSMPSYNTTYKFRVKAFRDSGKKRVYGKTSGIITVKTEKNITVEIKEIHNIENTQILLKWTKLSNVDGYQIYRAKGSKGTFVKLRTISNKNTYSYTDKTPKAGYTYYYKVRAFWKENGKTVYSSFGSPKHYAKRKIIFIGDSRVYTMAAAVSDNESVWVSKVGAEFTWLKDTGVPKIENKIGKNTDVCIWIGTNDVGNINDYVKYYNQKIALWKSKGAKVYIISVGPVETDPFVTNEDIKKFNKILKSSVKNATYIDLYTSLNRNGFETFDGIHYDTLTSKKIYRYIRSKI